MYKYIHNQMLHMYNIYTYVYVQYIVYQYDMICLSKLKTTYIC